MARVRPGDRVQAYATVLGHILKPAHQVHLTAYENRSVVNPLMPGRLTPYTDTTRPIVHSISVLRAGGGGDLLPGFVRGRVELVVDADDMPTQPVKGKWHELPTAPATFNDGMYELVVTASDARGNSGSEALRITIHNWPGWVGS